jgi:hypothetical protein
MRHLSKVLAAFAIATALPAHAQVSSAPPAQVDAWGVGWIGSNEGAVPSTFWANTNAETLGPLMASIQPRELAPSGAAVLGRILMSRGKGPAGATDITAERIRLLEQLGQTENAIELRKRYSGADWGKPGERLSAEWELLLGNDAAGCAVARGKPATDADWMPARALCGALAKDTAATSLATEQIARSNEQLGVWLIGALGAINSPGLKKPDGRYASPLEASISTRAKLSVPNNAFNGVTADIAAQVALNKDATNEQRRAAMRPAFYGGKIKAADVLAILALKDEAAKPAARGAKPDYLALALAASADKDAKPEARATAYAAALRAAETLNDGRLIAAVLAPSIKALPKNDATLPYADALARAALMAGDERLAADWRKHLGTLAKDKQDAWVTARIDLMLALAGASTEKLSPILNRMIAAAPYPDPGAQSKSATSGEQQLAVRRIENTRALFLAAGLQRDLTADQRALLSAQRTAGRGVSDAAIARITAAARQDAKAEAALATIAQLGPDVSALSFAGLSDLLSQLVTIGLTDDANAIALEALQVWKAL